MNLTNLVFLTASVIAAMTLESPGLEKKTLGTGSVTFNHDVDLNFCPLCAGAARTGH